MSEPRRSPGGVPGPWPRRLALAALAAAIPLVFFGGSVTTLDAGLAIDGWLVLEPGRGDHFLWLYPVDKWFRDLGTFVEHTHRLLGSLVGLLALAAFAATWARDRRRAPRVLSLAALLGVIGQGTIGGLRVLERSADLAFLHGAIAQAVLALLGASWVASTASLARSFGAPSEDEAARSLRKLSVAAVAAVYLQIVAGAWLRHGGSQDALALHLVGVLPVTILVPVLAQRMRDAASRTSEPGGTKLLVLRRWLLGALLGQIGLGLAALAVVSTPDPAGLGRAVIPTLHVVVGGILLLACVASSMWIHRCFPAATRVPEEASAETLGATR